MRITCTNGKKEKNVKAFYEFGNDPMKMYSNTKEKLKVEHIIEDVRTI